MGTETVGATRRAPRRRGRRGAAFVAVSVVAVLASASGAAADWTWTERSWPTGGGGTMGGLGASATDGGTSVLWSGVADGPLGSTWMHDGTEWTPVCGTDTAPGDDPCPQGPRVGAGLGTGPTGIVLYGGQDTMIGEPGSAFGDTWRFTGAGWELVCDTAGCGPAARVAHAMAGNGSVVVLHGGLGGSPFHDDTWVFDGSDWTQVCGGGMGACGPGPLAGASLVWDGTAFVLHGGVGFDGDQVERDSTWTFDPGTQTWTQVCGDGMPACGPGHRAFAPVASIGGAPGAVMAAGMRLLRDEGLNDFWRWDGTGWSELDVPWSTDPYPMSAPPSTCTVQPFHLWTVPDAVAAALRILGSEHGPGAMVVAATDDEDAPSASPCGTSPEPPAPPDPGGGGPGDGPPGDGPPGDGPPPQDPHGDGGGPGGGGPLDGPGGSPGRPPELPRTGDDLTRALLGLGLALTGVGVLVLGLGRGGVPAGPGVTVRSRRAAPGGDAYRE